MWRDQGRPAPWLLTRYHTGIKVLSYGHLQDAAGDPNLILEVKFLPNCMENASTKNILIFPGENLKLRIQLGLKNNLGSWEMRRGAQKYLPHLLSQSQGYGALKKHFVI